MSLLKSTFGVTSGKFPGFIVRHRGTKIDLSKINYGTSSINKTLRTPWATRMPCIYIFISNLFGRCKALSRLMKKGVAFEWDELCQTHWKIPKHISQNLFY